jgi:hypothetical protein
VWWEPTTAAEQDVAQSIRRMSSRSSDWPESPILGIGSIAIEAELKPMLLIDEFFFPLLPRATAKIFVAGFELTGLWRGNAAASHCFVPIAEVYKYGTQALNDVLASLEPPGNTVIAFITNPERALFQKHAPGIRLGGGGDGTLGIGFQSLDGRQQFTTAGHVHGYDLRNWAPNNQYTLPGVSVTKKHLLGLLTVERPFGTFAKPRNTPLLGTADIAIIDPFNAVASDPVSAVINPTADMEICTMYGAESGTRSGWKAGAVSAGKIALDWPNSWFAISTRQSGFATQGDSGARVHNSNSELLGHLVATAGVRTVGGTAQGAIVQDIVFQRKYVEAEFGVSPSANLVVAR